MDVLFDPQFRTDLKRLIRTHPHLHEEIDELIYAIEDLGGIPPGYNPHPLTNPRATYTGYWELHLQEGRFDVLVIYSQHVGKQIIRFIRIGSHQDLFNGPEL
ncbi:type II toxin-antitoxin system mRNA interferase toxin, RelE/StbE family [Schaalia sp. ZJ405]|uniref:type II toxin-antitoxin system RelE/ParE family toxin n=1 Tax=Schaalia sp. ZJ405 TaxID=2709403 RepID=UPI0013ED366B|nr:type II toxin-antitoxin system mRNA interferase toxin, RelE/StbE family [Schaalia sp. ZJ405]QPK80460.1 type II toxin-antitoxin system mRNA interferase toxin, RelE/StbE family [Schaalia sp. ZJ405]